MPPIRKIVLLALLASVPLTTNMSYPESAPGAWHDTSHVSGEGWMEEANKRIEKIRKADIAIRVSDSGGRGIPGVNVSIRMKRHKFVFGTAVAAKLITGKSKDSKTYRLKVKTLFNKVVLENDLKWGEWLSRTERYNREQTLKALSWLKRNNIAVRGHWAALGYTKPNLPVKYDPSNPELYRQALLNHIRDKLPKVKDYVVEWDAINHIIAGSEHNLGRLYGRQIWLEILNLAHELVPNDRLFVNEGRVLIHDYRNRRAEYLNAVKYLLEHRAPINGIGMMGHFSPSTLNSPPRLLAILDEFAGLGLPILITEFDARFGRRGKVDGLDEAELNSQAQYTKNFITLIFSHPAVEGILLWGFWEGRHWYPSAALFREDWSIKPNGMVWRDLVFRKWWTNENRITDGQGGCTVRGFKGVYEITVTTPQGKLSGTYLIDKPKEFIKILFP